MADEEPGLVDSVNEATNGVGSEALAAISNLGGGSGNSIATDVVSRLAATVSGRSGGFAPKVITTITKHGIAGIQRVEPIEGVDRGYRAVAQDANGLESIRTVLDLDPREYDVTVTREEGAGVVEFVQQESEEPEADDTGAADSAATDEPERGARAPVKGTVADGVVDDGAHRRVVDAGGARAPVVETREPDEHDSKHTRELQRVRAEAEKAKAKAEAQQARAETEKARAEAEQARAEAEAAKARARTERAKAQTEAESVERDRDPVAVEKRELGQHDESATRPTTERPAFSSSRTIDGGFDPDGSAANEPDTTGGWGLRDESGSSGAVEAGFGEFTAATPVAGPGESVADGSTAGQSSSSEDGDARVAIEDTGDFEF